MNEKSIMVELSDLAARLSTHALVTVFDDDPQRINNLGIQAPGMFADFSKQRIDKKALDCLLKLAELRDLTGFFARMRAGDTVNTSESRAAQHMALRAPEGARSLAQGKTIAPLVEAERNKMRLFANKLRAGKIKGITGRPISTLVHVGIGGSDLGPRLLAQALRRFSAPGITLRFAANLDAADINDALEGCDPETTMVVVVSKTFSTRETLANANVARAWLVQHLGENASSKHMIAVSSNLAAIREFGIAPDNVFTMYDWVGGRYSLWSAVGLSLMAGLKEGAFDEVLAGAAAMDTHALNTPVRTNAPLLSGLISYWNQNFLGMQTRAIVPYASRLALLPSYLQQLIMESNGKSVQAAGAPADHAASPIVFGAEGTNAQHAFFQHLHQGRHPVPVDFIGFVQDQEHNPSQHRGVLANMLGQSRALMIGTQGDNIEPQKTMPGNRPSTTLLLDALSPFCLGALLAFYEHETVTLAVLCGVNPFDQWGVELGKHVALDLQGRLENADTDGIDPSTTALIERITKPL